MFITRILPFDQLDEIGVFLTLDAVVSNDNRGFRILEVWGDQSLQRRGREAFTPQEVTDRIVALVRLMVGQVYVRVVERRTQQILLCSLFSVASSKINRIFNHKRKSYLIKGSPIFFKNISCYCPLWLMDAKETQSLEHTLAPLRFWYYFPCFFCS